MDGEPPQEEDFSQIPLVERSQHKNWKARLSAYNDVIAKSAKTASDTDPFFRPFVSDGPLLRKWCLDANAVAQEKGIEAVLAIAQYSGESSAKTRIDVVPGLVDKALGAARAGTKKKGAELCAMYVEVENGGEGVMTEVMVGFDSKQPKIVAGSVACLKEIVEQFGVPTLGNVKPLLKHIPKLFAHTDKNVRAEASALVVALYTYLGPALTPSLADLKPVQMSELQKSFDALDAAGKGAGTGKPTRYTRKAQRDREAAEASGGAEDDAGAAPEEATPIDPKDLLDPVNVLALFPADLDERLSSTKWKDRVEVLEECNKVLSQPQNAKIAENNADAYGSLASTLGAKCKSDANINVVIETAKVIEGLANGLGKAFGRHRAAVMVGCLERLKERKASVVDALGKALDAVAGTVPISEIVEDVLTAAKSKNPQVREGTLKFLLRALQSTTTAPGKDQVKPMAETLVAALGDSVEPVRSAAAECLGTMMKLIGERAFNPYIEGVGEIQMTKVKDAFGKAEIKYRAGGAAKPVAKPAAKPAGVPAVKKPMPKPAAPPSSPPIKASGKFGGDELLDDFSAPPARAPPARFARPAASPPIKASGKFEVEEQLTDFSAPPARAPPARFARPGAAKPAAPSAPASPAPPKAAPPAVKKPAPPAAGPSKPAAKAGPSKTLAVSPSEPVKFRYTPEDAAAKASEAIPAEYHTKLADAAWKTRLEAAEEMIKWVEEGGGDATDSEVLFRFLGKTPGWGEKNFQVSAKLYQVMSLMAERSSTFGKPSAALAIGPLSDKLGDMKLKKPAGDALAVFAEKTSLAFVLAQAYEPMQKQKAPKAQADGLTWVKQQLIDFGIAGIPLRDLIAFVKTGLQSPNAAVRSSATQVLVTVRIFVGADISGFLEDLNPQLLTTINSEFDKVAGQAPPEPTKTSVDLRDAVPAAGGKGKGGAGGSDPLDDLIPRVDLDKLVNQTSVIADHRSDAWKTRKEAYEALNALLEVKSNSRLKPNMGEIGSALKKAMSDTNLSVKMLALGIVSKIATGMGSPFDKYTRLLVAPVASVCADQKATTRAAGLATLTAIADACRSLDSMYVGLGASLETPNPALRAAVLGWLADRVKADPPPPGSDMTPLAGPMLSCLEDRNGDVRKGATTLLPFVVQHAGYEFVMDQTSKLKPASKATIVPLINNARAAAPAAASSSAPTSKAPPSAAAAPTPAKAASGARPKVLAAAAASSVPGSPRPTAASARTIAPPARSLAMKAIAPTARPAPEDRPVGIPKPRALVRPASVMSHATTASSSSSRPIPFVSTTIEARTARLKRDTTRWILDPHSRELPDYLAAQMEPNTSPEIFSQLFSKDHRAEEDYMSGLTTLAEFFDRTAPTAFGIAEDEVQALQLANVDLALKYAALRLLSNNTQVTIRCLELVGKVVETMQSGNERFSDAEARLFVPALVMKLGDSKFGAKLAPIFDALDKVIAASQVVQLLITYGLEDKSAGKTCKNESLALIEKAYRKRGSILRTKDDRGFYELLAKCISDSGTRNAALGVMALLQLQGGSAALNAVVDAMPTSAKDMLANRRATLAASKAAPGVPPQPAVARVSETVDGTPGKLRRPAAASPSVVSRAAKEQPAADSPSAARGIPRGIASPSSKVPKSSLSSPSTSRIAAPSATAPLGSTRAIPSTAGTALNRLQRPTDLFSGTNGRSLQPLPRASASSSRNGNDPTLALINSIRNDDPGRSVDAMKHVQVDLDEAPEKFLDNAQTLVDTLLDELERAFSPPEKLNDPVTFRLVKHIIQTLNGCAGNQDLMKRLSFDSVYALIHALSLRLIQADRLGGLPQELVSFINLILITALATPDRYIVFKVMFELLLDLTRDFTENNTRPDEEIACHADLVIKCLWKRCKVLDDDLATGRLQAGPLLGILEDFARVIPPSEYRKREKMGIALGDMPLRTIKTIMQKIIVYARNENLEIYDILVGEFGDQAADAIVYTYVFRLAQPEAEKPRPKPVAPSSRSLSPLLPATASRPASAATSHTSRPVTPRSDREVPAPAEAPVENSPPKEDPELVRLIKNTRTSQTEGIDKLYQYTRDHPESHEEVQAAITSVLGPTVGLYIKRALEGRKNQDEPSPSRIKSPSSPIRSPSRPESMPARAAARKSLGPRPSSLAVVDKSAPIDAQLAQYKNMFTRSEGYLTGSASPESGPTRAAISGGRLSNEAISEEKVGSGGGQPLSEISPQGRMGPRPSDVD